MSKEENLMADLGLKGAAPELGNIGAVSGTVPAVTPNPLPAKVTKPKVNDFSNPTTIVFPTDIHGLTSKMKKEMISLASRIGGDAEKLDLVKEVLELLVKHIHARFDEAKDNRTMTYAPMVVHPVEN